MPKPLKDYALLAFLLMAGAIAVNMLLLQAAPTTPAAKRAAERAHQRLIEARERSLALPPATGPLAEPGDGARAVSTVAGPKSQAKGPWPGEGVAAAEAETVRAVQRELKLLGYETGSPTGTPTLVLRAAILAYEHDRGQGLTAEPTEELLKALLMGLPPAPAGTVPPVAKPQHKAQVERVVRTVQQSLSALGYNTGKADGVVGEDTERAIRDFEVDQGLAESGRISGSLISRLARQMSDNRLATGR